MPGFKKCLNIYPFTPNCREVYKGVAYCSAEDEFDIKEGMKIARRRAMAKADRAQNKYFVKVINTLDTYQQNCLKVLSQPTSPTEITREKNRKYKGGKSFDF